MRVLFLDHAEALGGSELSLLGLLRTLDRSRFEPVLACPPGILADRAHALDVSIAELRLEKLRCGNPLAAVRRLRSGRHELRKLLADNEFDAVHANTLRSAVYVSTVAPRLGVPFLWHVRDVRVPAWTRWLLLRRCQRAIATSEFLADWLGRGPAVRIVPNGVDTESVPDATTCRAVRRELSIPDDAPVIGCLGRVRPWKGQERFIELAALLAPELPEAHFLVVGGTLFPDPGRDYVAELKEQAAALGVADRVTFTGHRDDPLAALGAMDVVVNCSLDEPFGRVLIEAMACGRPVAAFHSGAVPELVKDDQTGFLAPPSCVEALADAVRRLLDDRELAQTMGDAGRERVTERFALQASTRRMEAVYGELLSGVDNPPHPA
jgi:glycosyltransferase involved in cell wall biosynthesis